MRFHFCLEHKSETKVGTDSPKQDNNQTSPPSTNNHVTEITIPLNLKFYVKIFCKIRYVCLIKCAYMLVATDYTLLITWLHFLFRDSPVQIISQSSFYSVCNGLTDNPMNLLPARPPLSLYFVCKSLQLFAFFFAMKTVLFMNFKCKCKEDTEQLKHFDQSFETGINHASFFFHIFIFKSTTRFCLWKTISAEIYSLAA